jgi:hypothetical protein
MKRMAALIGALLLTLVLAAPAAADQKVLVAHWEWGTTPDNAYEVPVTLATFEFECERQIYQGGYDGTGNVWFWFEKGVDPETDPWTHGLWVEEDIDYFSSEPNMGGIVVSGHTKIVRHLSDFDPDTGTWREKWNGNIIMVQAPHTGTHIFTEHFGGVRVMAWGDPASGFGHDWEHAVGNYRAYIDPEALCAALGTELKS